MQVNSSSAVHARNEEDLRRLTWSTALMACYQSLRKNLTSGLVTSQDITLGLDLIGI